MKTQRRSPCPINVALELLGDRWTLLIVRDLIFGNRSRYHEFLDSPEGISTNILADRLKKLDCAGIVTRSPDPEHGSRVRYAITERGLDLLPVLVELMAWSARYEQTGASPAFGRRLRSDPKGVAREIRKRFEAARSRVD